MSKWRCRGVSRLPDWSLSRHLELVYLAKKYPLNQYSSSVHLAMHKIRFKIYDATEIAGQWPPSSPLKEPSPYLFRRKIANTTVTFDWQLFIRYKLRSGIIMFRGAFVRGLLFRCQREAVGMVYLNCAWVIVGCVTARDARPGEK